jgi:hypothetical protein
MTLRESAYITITGYGPCSQFTLAEWLHARDLFRKNQKAALAQINLPKEVIK